MSQDLSARRQELMFMLGDTVEDELRKAEESLASALKQFLERRVSLEEWEEARRDALSSSLPPFFASMSHAEFIESMIQRERPEVTAELERNLHRWIRDAGEKVVQLRAIVNMPAEERATLQREFEEIEGNWPSADLQPSPSMTDEEQRLSARRAELLYMLHGNVEADLRRAERVLFFADSIRNDYDYASSVMADPIYMPSIDDDLINSTQARVRELRTIMDMSPEERAALQQELAEIEVQLGIIPTPEYAEEEKELNEIQSDLKRVTERANEIILELDDNLDLGPDERAALLQELREIEVKLKDMEPELEEIGDRLGIRPAPEYAEEEKELNEIQSDLKRVTERANEIILELDDNLDLGPDERAALLQELREIEVKLKDMEPELDEIGDRLGIRPAPEHENQDNLMSLESRVSEIIHELDDNLDLGPDERAALEQELYGIQVKMERLEERANEIILELDDNLDLDPDERAALEQELREIEGKPGIMDASEEEGEQPSETASVQHDDTKPQWQPTTEEERRLVERYDELMYALHGMVEEDWHGLGTTYDALYEIDPTGDAARNTLKEMERLKKIMDMTPEERAALEAEAERIGAELKQREAEWRAGQEENPQQKSPFAASQKAQTAFVASLTETLQNLAKQGGNTLDLGAQNLPYSAISGQAFSGANATLLTLKAAEKGFADNRWMTFRQIESYRQDHPDVRIRAGEKGTTVLLPQQVSFIEKNGQREILSAEQVLELEIQRNKGLSVPEVKSGYLFAPYSVFNAQQIEGFPPKEVQAPGLSLREKRDLVDRFVAAAGIKMDYTASPTLSRWDEKANRLIMSVPHLFQRVGNFISQKLHEAFHAFGHASRENSPHYASTTLKGRALAEMRAEMFSAVAGRYLGMEQNVSSMARRVDVWNRSFSDGDVQNLFHAAVDAGKMLSLLDQFAAGETPAAKWFPASETWEQSYHQAESNELKAALDWVGDALNGAWSDAPLNAALGAEIQQAIKADTPLAQLRDYLVEAWPYLAASPSLPVVNLANSYAKYLPDGVLEHERELVAATISGARRMQAVQGSAQVESSTALLEQEQPVDKRQTLTDFDALTDPVERVRVLLRDPALLDEALKQDPKGVRELADLCDMVSQTLHMELDAAQQEQDLMNMPPASSPKKTERARM